MYAVIKRPMMPLPLTLPLKIFPGKAHGLILSSLLNRVFRVQREEGELDFLEGRVVCIKVSDAGLLYSLTVKNGRLAEAGGRAAELTISGTVYDYMLLITEREDPDTLFFQRHLIMDGDTSLGVHLKNMLAAVDFEELTIPKELRSFIASGLRLYERLL
ncbi:MAG: SCP2 sterol-binding domain-containing protein [Candidatus Thiodiazotropha sp.]|jgi:O2-independent ubiquinone biosynthesis accessory factor UbiT